METKGNPLADPRARKLVEKFESLSTSLSITASARSVVEAYFNDNYDKFGGWPAPYFEDLV